MKRHPSLTEERILEGAERAMVSLDNVGFCVACGEEAEGCEPDARNYKCEHCGKLEVFGAEELMLQCVG